MFTYMATYRTEEAARLAAQTHADEARATFNVLHAYGRYSAVPARTEPFVHDAGYASQGRIVCAVEPGRHYAN